MIGNTVETDLVGETISIDELWSMGGGSYPRACRGRVRAVTVSGDGYMRMWIECLRDNDIYLHRSIKAGEIVVISLQENHCITLHRDPL